MRGQCSNCRHWTVPHVRKAKFGKIAAGHCQIDDNLAHPSYSCDRYGPTMRALLGRFMIGDAEQAWMRAHPREMVVMQLRGALRAVWHEPGLVSLHGVLVAHLRHVRALMHADVLETEMSAGNPAGIDNEHIANVRQTQRSHPA